MVVNVNKTSAGDCRWAWESFSLHAVSVQTVVEKGSHIEGVVTTGQKDEEKLLRSPRGGEGSGRLSTTKPQRIRKGHRALAAY